MPARHRRRATTLPEPGHLAGGQAYRATDVRLPLRAASTAEAMFELAGIKASEPSAYWELMQDDTGGQGSFHKLSQWCGRHRPA